LGKIVLYASYKTLNFVPSFAIRVDMEEKNGETTGIFLPEKYQYSIVTGKYGTRL